MSDGDVSITEGDGYFWIAIEHNGTALGALELSGGRGFRLHLGDVRDDVAGETTELSKDARLLRPSA